NRLNFISGDSVFLNNYNINLGNTGILIGERSNSRVTGLSGGYIQRTQIIDAGAAINPGNLGIEITSAVNLGNTIVRRGHTKMNSMPAGAVSRYYDVIPANNSGLAVSIKFNYLDVERGALPENNLMLYSSASAGINWDFLGFSTADMIQNFVTKVELDKLNLFILADIGSILPVHLIYFNAKLVNRQTLLNWAVADESDVDHYEIERSADGIHFNNLFTINKKGTNAGTEMYESIDRYPVNGFNYYRLKIWDKTHHFKYSKIVQVYLGVDSNTGIFIFPNPAQDMISLMYTAGKNEQLQVAIYDAKASLISTKKVNVMAGRNEISFDIHVLPAGTYFVQLQGNGSKALQFIKQ
ncbi:MAG: T9SS type A sorting domain-containing protein, partial [Ferruginibacter sp.]